MHAELLKKQVFSAIFKDFTKSLKVGFVLFKFWAIKKASA
jgi:hypothetical protein